MLFLQRGYETYHDVRVTRPRSVIFVFVFVFVLKRECGLTMIVGVSGCCTGTKAGVTELRPSSSTRLPTPSDSLPEGGSGWTKKITLRVDKIPQILKSLLHKAALPSLDLYTDSLPEGGSGWTRKTHP